MDSIYDSMLNKMPSVLTSAVSFDVNLVNEFGRVFTYSIDNLLMRTYAQFQKYTLKSFDSQIDKLNKQMYVNDIIIKMRPILIRCINGGVLDPDDIIKIISDELKEPFENIKDIFAKQSIRKLVSVNIDNTILAQKKSEIESNIQNIDKYIFNFYIQTMKKF